MPLLRHLLARFSANPLPIITKRVSPLRKPTHGAKSGLSRMWTGEGHHWLPTIGRRSGIFAAARRHCFQPPSGWTWPAPGNLGLRPHPHSLVQPLNRSEGCANGKILFSHDSFRKRAEIGLYFLDLVALDSQVLDIPKFGAGYPFTFIANKSFTPFFKELLDVKDTDCLTIRPTPLKISSLTNVIIEWTAKSEVITQQIFQRLPVFWFITRIILTDKIWEVTTHGRLLFITTNEPGYAGHSPPGKTPRNAFIATRGEEKRTEPLWFWALAVVLFA
jgi:hypothetical protein